MTPFELRPYQEEAISRLTWSKTLAGNDICVLPTGAGKSIVIAELANRLDEPLLILQPSKEILEQNHAKLTRFVDPWEVGIYSASMGEKTVGHYTFATIQSIYKKPEKFTHFNTVIIDECHLVNPKNLQGMFTSFLKGIGNPKVIGLTATPYRMANNYVPAPWGWRAITTTKLINRLKERFWSRIVYNVNNGDLVEQGYLTPLEYIDMSKINHDQLPTNKSKSDFDLVAYEAILAENGGLEEALAHAQEIGTSILVFCSSVMQAEVLAEATPNSAVVTGTTPKKERERIISDFRTGQIKMVFNMGVLTTGFDHPELDCIVLARPTRSIGLYYQMLGRGVRLAPGKKTCKVIDVTSTVKTIGEIETIKLERRTTGWELVSSGGTWHNRTLYEHKVKRGVEREKKVITY
jgi:DNA repair protein RadD